jgi:hypothetical protein
MIDHTDISYEDLNTGVAESISSNDYPEVITFGGKTEEAPVEEEPVEEEAIVEVSVVAEKKELTPEPVEEEIIIE